MLREIYELKAKLVANNIHGLAVDIDETLSWTWKSWIAIMQEKFGNPENLDVDTFLKKYPYSWHVPYWQTPEIKDWFGKMIISGEFYQDTPIIENSNEVLNKINKTIPIVAYISNRSEKVRTETARWLAKHKFPKAELFLKPDYIDSFKAPQYKAELIKMLYPNALGIIDDFPEIINQLGKDYRGVVYCYQHSTGKKFSKDKAKFVEFTKWDDLPKLLTEHQSSHGR
jgi:hypothetical protein